MYEAHRAHDVYHTHGEVSRMAGSAVSFWISESMVNRSSDPTDFHNCSNESEFGVVDRSLEFPKLPFSQTNPLARNRFRRQRILMG